MTKVIFQYEDILYVVKDDVPIFERGATDAQTTTHEDTKNKYGKTLFLIDQCADVDIFENIMNCESVKEAWDIL